MAFVFSACGAESLLSPSSIPTTASILNILEPSSNKKMSTEDKFDASTDVLRTGVEIIQDRLYYIALESQPSNVVKKRKGKPLYYFEIDTALVYWNFFLDFGPLNLGQLYRFSKRLNELLDTKKDHTIVFYSSTAPSKRANATYLICAWQLLYLGRAPEEAYCGFRAGSEPKVSSNSSSPPTDGSSIALTSLPPFHDASPCKCTYDITVLDCLRGLSKARMYRFFDYDDFDVDEYEHFEQVENGDLNWIIKDRILAFAGPHFRHNVSAEGHCTLTPSHYIPYFQQHNVALVVRLNKKCYEESDFINAGINHFEQYYLDGSCPPIKILNRVVDAFESIPKDKAFAVHCKAGLGRTGTCIGAFMMKHYKFTASEAIAWMRICRPGMVIGPQQHFLQDIEQRMWHEGSVESLKPLEQRLAASVAESPRQDQQQFIEEKDKGSPKSVVVAAPHFPDDEKMQSDDPREGHQADGLLAARRSNQRKG